ncbi:MAG: hypothetical protein JO345_17100, partial [Streptosporangiaceae bacterium]|nr:hypothetical protein [Streptosporangiaceae bacterium]
MRNKWIGPTRRRTAGRVLAAFSVLPLAITAWTGIPLLTGTAQAAGTFSVRTYGATGNGSTNDAAAFSKAIAAASKAGGGTVLVPAGRYVIGNSIHMMSNVTMDLATGSTMLGTSSGYDPPEPTSFGNYQDFGHSHFHDAMIWGENLTHIGFIGSGTITGNGHFITGTPASGQADKLISLVGINGLTVSGITLENGGHFAMLIDDCTNVVSNDLNIQTASDRDGWNNVNVTNETITNITIASNDDALSFKGDYALGKVLPSGNVTVNGAHLSAKCCNALMFGSETCGNFSNYDFQNITITGAGKDGLGMVSEDGANISNVTYNGVIMSGVAGAIYEKVGTRLRCGGSPAVGSISDIRYENITGTGSGTFSPTLWGQSGHQISDVTFSNVHLAMPGGHAPMSTGVPTDNGDYNPNSIGTRPAFGFYLHNVTGIHFMNSSFEFSKNDGRPAILANTGGNVSV